MRWVVERLSWGLAGEGGQEPAAAVAPSCPAGHSLLVCWLFFLLSVAGCITWRVGEAGKAAGARDALCRGGASKVPKMVRSAPLREDVPFDKVAEAFVLPIVEASAKLGMAPNKQRIAQKPAFMELSWTPVDPTPPFSLESLTLAISMSFMSARVELWLQSSSFVSWLTRFFVSPEVSRDKWKLA